MTKSTNNNGIKKIAIAVVLGLTAISGAWALTKNNNQNQPKVSQQAASQAVDMNQFSYIIGYEAGKSMTTQIKQKVDIQQFTKNIELGYQQKTTQEPTKDKLNQMAFRTGTHLHSAFPKLKIDAFIQGIQAGYSKQASKYSDAQTKQIIKAYTEQRMRTMQAQMSANKKASDAFMAHIAKQPGVKKIQDGLYYQVVKQGNGPTPKATDTVKVDYKGTLINNTVFDQSANHGGPVEFKLNQVIPGWTAALEKMPQGSEWKIYIAPKLAYGAADAPMIGPEQALIFDVTLREVKKTA